MEFDPITTALCDIILYGLVWIAILFCIGTVVYLLIVLIKKVFCRAPKDCIGASTNGPMPKLPRFEDCMDGINGCNNWCASRDWVAGCEVCTIIFRGNFGSRPGRWVAIFAESAIIGGAKND